MDSLSQATGTAQDIVLKGKTYKVGELTIGALAKFENHVRAQKKEERKSIFADIIESAKETYPDGVPIEVFKEASATLSVKPSSDDIMAEANGSEGASYLLWLMLSVYQPSITLEEAGNLVSVDKIGEILAVMGLEGDTDSGNPPTPTASS